MLLEQSPIGACKGITPEVDHHRGSEQQDRIEKYLAHCGADCGQQRQGQFPIGRLLERLRFLCTRPRAQGLQLSAARLTNQWRKRLLNAVEERGRGLALDPVTGQWSLREPGATSRLAQA